MSSAWLNAEFFVTIENCWHQCRLVMLFFFFTVPRRLSAIDISYSRLQIDKLHSIFSHIFYFVSVLFFDLSVIERPRAPLALTPMLSIAIGLAAALVIGALAIIVVLRVPCGNRRRNRLKRKELSQGTTSGEGSPGPSDKSLGSREIDGNESDEKNPDIIPDTVDSDDQVSVVLVIFMFNFLLLNHWSKCRYHSKALQRETTSTGIGWRTFNQNNRIARQLHNFPYSLCWSSRSANNLFSAESTQPCSTWHRQQDDTEVSEPRAAKNISKASLPWIFHLFFAWCNVITTDETHDLVVHRLWRRTSSVIVPHVDWWQCIFAFIEFHMVENGLDECRAATKSFLLHFTSSYHPLQFNFDSSLFFEQRLQCHCDYCRHRILTKSFYYYCLPWACASVDLIQYCLLILLLSFVMLRC